MSIGMSESPFVLEEKFYLIEIFIFYYEFNIEQICRPLAKYPPQSSQSTQRVIDQLCVLCELCGKYLIQNSKLGGSKEL